MRFCKYCGKEIDKKAEVCPHCQGNLGERKEEPNPLEIKQKMIDFIKKNRKNPIIYFCVGILFIVVIVFVVINGATCKISNCNNKKVSGGKYCYSHECSTTDCHAARLSYSNYCYSHYLVYDKDAQEAINKVSSYQLKISGVRVYTKYSYTYAEGTLTNNSDKTVSYVKIKGSFETSYGTVVDTDWTYAVGTEGLAPGETCKWKMSVDKDYSIDSCKVSILDFNQ